MLIVFLFEAIGQRISRYLIEDVTFVFKIKSCIWLKKREMKMASGKRKFLEIGYKIKGNNCYSPYLIQQKG